MALECERQIALTVRRHVIRIRAMAALDSSEVLRINAVSQPGVAPLAEEELARLLTLPNEHLVATTCAEATRGYALAFHRDAPYDGEEFRTLRSVIPEPFIYIDQVAVAPSHQGLGLGRALYAGLERTGFQRRIRFLCCEVNTNPANPHSLAFHKHLGFEFLAPLSTLDGREVVLLTKPLSA